MAVTRVLSGLLHVLLGIATGKQRAVNLGMQRLDQVLRELQPVLKTLNDKSNALVFEAKDKKDPQPKGAK